MGESLNPSVLSRLVHEWRPDWTRTVAARRVAAGALVVLAAVAALRSDPHGDQTDIVVAARDLSPGVELTAAMCGSKNAWPQRFPTDLSPPSTRLSDRRSPAPPAAAKCSPTCGCSVRGWPSPRRARTPASCPCISPTRRCWTWSGRAMWWTCWRPADDDVAIRGWWRPTPSWCWCRRSRRDRAPAGDRVVLVALPAHAANDVAGATLMQTVTLTFH